MSRIIVIFWNAKKAVRTEMSRIVIFWHAKKSRTPKRHESCFVFSVRWELRYSVQPPITRRVAVERSKQRLFMVERRLPEQYSMDIPSGNTWFLVVPEGQPWLGLHRSLAYWFFILTCCLLPLRRFFIRVSSVTTGETSGD